MAFNFFQRKSNRPDSNRNSKVKISDTKSDSVSIQKKGDALSPKKTSNAPQGTMVHISEKASNLLSQNSYVFKVEKSFNKVIVKKTLEDHYGVKVALVRILNTKPKKRVRGNIIGKKSGYKKAIAQLKEGHKIEF